MLYGGPIQLWKLWAMDKYPVTTEGRMIAAVLMTRGVGICRTFAGYIASILMTKKED